MKALIGIALAASIATPAISQEQMINTEALMKMIVAKHYCQIDPPRDFAILTAQKAMLETGKSAETTYKGAAMAAKAVGDAWMQNGSLPSFCARIGIIYAGIVMQGQ